MHKKNSLEKRLIGNKKILLIFSILAVVAVSGCISSLGLGPQQQTVEAPNDVMSFSDNTVIPNPPILTGDTFTTDFTIKNLDNFDDAKNVKIELYDWGVCTPSSCNPAPPVWESIDSAKLQTSYSASFNDISPNDVQQVECQFKSPSSEKIGGLSANCPIRYKLTYDFSGITTTELNVISNNKSQAMQRAGQTPSTTSTQSKSRGPIKVDFSFGVNQPVRTSTIDADPAKSSIIKIPMYITVENKGSGKIPKTTDVFVLDKTKKCENFKSGNCYYDKEMFFCNNGNIENCASDKYDIKKNPDFNSWFDSFCTDNKGCTNKLVIDLTIKIPAALTSSGTTSTCEEIKCDGFFTGSADGTDNCKLTLTKKIDFVKDKSQIFRCELTSPSDSVVTDMKTYSIQSNVSYTYQLDNDFSVAIKPMTFG